jgi:hypothetical protein
VLRTLNNIDICTEVAKMLCSGTDQASGEVDCFGYVDYFNSEQVNGNGKNWIKSLSFPDLEVWHLRFD